MQNTVIAFGEQGVDPEAIAEAMQTTYPSLSVNGSAVEATPSAISIRSNTLHDKSPASAENPWVVTVAVGDTSGACLGGVVHGFPLPTTTLEIEEPAVCTADAVFDAVAPTL